MSPSRVPQGETRGCIVPIGGAENKENDPRILARFVKVSGGDDADIVVIPTASRAHETGDRYEKLFRELGARRVDEGHGQGHGRAETEGPGTHRHGRAVGAHQVGARGLRP